MYQEHIDTEAEIVLAIKQGNITNSDLFAPNNHLETGLAHVFFFKDTVFKQYKIVNDTEHFIKGVLAPTSRRFDFIERDFAINRHFSRGIYKKIYAPALHESVTFVPYDRSSPHVLIEMERLDFSKNFHEQLLQSVVTDEQLYQLGQYVAQSTKEAPHDVPTGLNWYDLAHKRLDFLEQFIDWMPAEKGKRLSDAHCVGLLRAHLDSHRTAYESITSEQLVITMDNHDENIFLRDDGPVFIDVVPPMESWWYGVSLINLANIVVNVETLHTNEAARLVEQGYLDFYGSTTLPEPEYTFTKALAYVISAVHFGSIPEKDAVGEKYIDACQHIGEWL